MFRPRADSTAASTRARPVKLTRAFRFAMDEAGALCAGTCIVVVTAGFGMYHLEHDVTCLEHACGACMNDVLVTITSYAFTTNCSIPTMNQWAPSGVLRRATDTGTVGAPLA